MFGVALGTIPLPLLASIPSRLLALVENDVLQTLPLYVLMGAMLNQLPLADVLFRTARRALRWTGGGAPLAGLGLGVLLAPMNGSVGASAATLASTVLPRLTEAHVPRVRGAALVCVASTLGVVVPPSLVLILLGDAMLRAHTEAVNATGVAAHIVDTQDVLRGALVPAAVLLLLCGFIAWRRNRRKWLSRVPAPGPAAAEWIPATVTALFVVTLLTGATLGYLRVVEAAATGGIALWCYGVATRTLPRAKLTQILCDTMGIIGALFTLLVGATIFTLVVRAYGTDRLIADWLSGMGGSARRALVVILLMLALCALVLDAYEMIFVVIPIVMPPLLMLVPDATWVAVLTLFALQASFLVPPLGYAVLLIRHRLARPVGTARFVRALSPYLAAQLLVLAMVLAYPASLWRRPIAATATAVDSAPMSDEEAAVLFQRQQELDEVQAPRLELPVPEFAPSDQDTR